LSCRIVIEVETSEKAKDKKIIWVGKGSASFFLIFSTYFLFFLHFLFNLIPFTIDETRISDLGLEPN